MAPSSSDMRNVKTMSILTILGSAYFFASACGAGKQSSEDDDDDGVGSTTSTTSMTSGGGAVGSGGYGGGTSVPGGPLVESFTADPAVIDHNDDVLLVAEVSDPDGLADIVGGVVKDDAGAMYGTLLKSGGGGTFALTLHWDQIEAVAAIEFTSGTHGTRTLVAEFTDASGNIGTKDLTLALTCHDAFGYCDGNCIDTNTSNLHCGSCNHACLCVDG